MTTLKEYFANAVESLVLVSILAWSVFVGVGAVSSPSVTREPRGTVEIHELGV